MRHAWLAVLLLTWSAVIGSAAVAVEPSAQLPIVVVEDNQGDVIGPTIGLDQGFPVVLFTDPTAGGRQLPLGFLSSTGFRAEELQVLYTSTDCTGQAYLQPPSIRSGLRHFSGVSYGVGLGPLGHIFLFRADDDGPGSSISINSLYSTIDPDFADPSKCEATNGSQTLVTATPVVDIDVELPAPYSLQ